NAPNKGSASGNRQVRCVSCAFGEANPAAVNKPLACSLLLYLKNGGPGGRRTAELPCHSIARRTIEKPIESSGCAHTVNPKRPPGFSALQASLAACSGWAR